MCGVAPAPMGVVRVQSALPAGARGSHWARRQHVDGERRKKVARLKRSAAAAAERNDRDLAAANGTHALTPLMMVP